MRSASARRTDPSSGASSPFRILSRVVFPLPFDPTRPMRTPGESVRFRSWNSLRPPSVLPMPSASISRLVFRSDAVKSIFAVAVRLRAVAADN